MQFTIVPVLFALLSILSMVSSTTASPILLKRDVYNPPITSPKASDTFVAGESIIVRWDTSVLPKGNKNEGRILLGHLTEGSENLDVEHPLASGFLLSEGSHKVTFPRDLSTRDSYIVVLMGDSGNTSPAFTIKAHH